MAKKILLLGNSKSHLAERLTQEATVTGVDFTALSLNAVRVVFQNGEVTVLGPGDVNLRSFDIVYLYAMGSKMPIALEIARVLSSQGVKIVDEVLASGALPHDKLFALGQNILPSPNTTFYFSLTEADAASITYPVIAKSIHGSMSRGVRLLNSPTEMIEFRDHFGTQVIVQEYLPVKADYRVLVVGDKVIGVLQRNGKNLKLLGLTREQRVVLPTIPDEVLARTVLAAKQKGLSIAGVDIAEHDGQFYCFEINSSPRVKSLEKRAGVNVAKAILDFLAS